MREFTALILSLLIIVGCFSACGSSTGEYSGNEEQPVAEPDASSYAEEISFTNLCGVTEFLTAEQVVTDCERPYAIFDGTPDKYKFSSDFVEYVENFNLLDGEGYSPEYHSFRLNGSNTLVFVDGRQWILYDKMIINADEKQFALCIEGADGYFSEELHPDSGILVPLYAFDWDSADEDDNGDIIAYFK